MTKNGLTSIGLGVLLFVIVIAGLQVFVLGPAKKRSVGRRVFNVARYSRRFGTRFGDRAVTEGRADGRSGAGK